MHLQAFCSSEMNTEIHDYYKLASAVTECQRDGTLSAQKLEELKQKFYMNIHETDVTEIQVEDCRAIQEEGAVEVNFQHSKYVLLSVD